MSKGVEKKHDSSCTEHGNDDDLRAYDNSAQENVRRSLLGVVDGSMSH